MNIKNIKPGSSTILVLNYLGMRKRCKRPWVTPMDVANFFPHIFRKRGRSYGSDGSTVLNRLVDAGFLAVRQNGSIKEYSITEYGSTVPTQVRVRMQNSPYFVNRTDVED